jgi:hypothetical protein
VTHATPVLFWYFFESWAGPSQQTLKECSPILCTLRWFRSMKSISLLGSCFAATAGPLGEAEQGTLPDAIAALESVA